jgi:hypothetical protein
MGLKQRYRHGIEVFCHAQGIAIPPSFYRQAASRYVAIDLAACPPRLVAHTWLNKDALIYFLQQQTHPTNMRVLDFHDRREMTYDGDTLRRGACFY